MYRVRYYGEMYHPDHFKRGVRGWYIRALNWVRWKLETYIQSQCVRYLSAQAALPPSEVKMLMRNFKLDVRAEELQKDQTSPLTERGPQTATARSAEYAAGSQRSVLDTFKADDGKEKPLRPGSIEDMAARYGQSPIRSRRYAGGRGRHLIADAEDSFEAVPKKEE